MRIPHIGPRLARAGVWGGALALLGGAAIATGAIPGGDGAVSGCVAKNARTSKTGLLGPNVTLDRQGTLRAIDAEAGQECSADEQPLTFNVQGQKGDPGPPGPTASAFASNDPQPNVEMPVCCASPPKELIATDLEMPFAGRLIANASLDFYSGDPFNTAPTVCSLQVASGPAFTDFQDISQATSHSNGVAISPTGGANLAAGTYRVRAACLGSYNEFDRGDLTVIATRL
jgi:hypothetical protein